MRTVDLTPLINNDHEYDKAYVNVSEKYKCNWDDSVHDSYLRLVKDIQEYSSNIHRIRCKTESLEKEAEALNVESMMTKAESLCREANSI